MDEPSQFDINLAPKRHVDESTIRSALGEGVCPKHGECERIVVTSETMKCPNCGNPTTGKFCSHCGADLNASCAACGSRLFPGSKFCHQCGRSAGTTAPMPAMKSWVLAGGATVIALLAIVAWFTAAKVPDEPPVRAFDIAASDLAQMTPRALADQLFDRVMIAQERGDGASVDDVRSMAVQAYAVLGRMDADARYHVGLLHAVGGNLEQTQLQADSLAAEVPGHLFVFLLRATVAEGNAAVLANIYGAFLDNYDREIASAKDEYAAHANSIKTFLTEAQAAAASAGTE